MNADKIYQQSLDKQRIVITGSLSSLIGSIVSHVLASNNRKFEWYGATKVEGASVLAPVVIIEAQEQLADYHHHILLLSGVSSTRLAELEALTDATPKGGIIIYPEADKTLKSVATRERTDVQVIPYNTYKHEVKDGITSLLSSTNEKFPILLKSEQELLCIGAARELLKKIGIGSSQFYKAVSTFRP